jgi:beta-phosphoglucomutase-like phosphatase (HAD superfamily)
MLPTTPLHKINVLAQQTQQAIAGTKLAICSASTKTSCMFVLENLLGELLEGFDLILAGDDVERRKPDPMIYDEAAKRLGISRDRCIVVEDSLIGLQAALGAGMKCIITHTPSTASQDFAGAVKIYPELGDNVSAKDLLNFLTES